MILTLIDKKTETKDVNTYVFKSDVYFIWKAGQYLIYSLKHKNQDKRGKMRFFTISSPPFFKNPSITTRIDPVKGSSFKKALNNLKLGEKINAKGPDGDFIIDDFKKSYFFIAQGMGLTPFRSILKQLEFENKDLDIEFFYSGKDKNIIFKDEFDSLRLKNLKIKYFIGKRIREKDIISIKDFKKRQFYISGPDSMVEDMEKILLGLGIKKENIKSDYFSGYLS
ncbi:MAG TPA: FAD-dependent oxidoreductase [Candidatus Sulfotelmatobacter sp.]|nr:FAD-dependent oxidoreductase [Candidatus Sulfotelmatobacter sp.]